MFKINIDAMSYFLKIHLRRISPRKGVWNGVELLVFFDDAFNETPLVTVVLEEC